MGCPGGDAQEAVENAVWSLLESFGGMRPLLAPEVLGSVYPICLCLSLCQPWPLSHLTDLPDPLSFLAGPPTLCSFSGLPPLSGSPPPPGLEQSGGSSRPGGQLPRDQSRMFLSCRGLGGGGGGPGRLLETR